MNTNERPKNSRGRIRWSEEDRNQLMEEYARSGFTKKAFCLERNINLGTFHGWFKRARLKKSKKARGTKPRFYEIKLPAAPPSSVEIILPGGARVCLHGKSEREDLAALIRGIAGC